MRAIDEKEKEKENEWEKWSEKQKENKSISAYSNGWDRAKWHTRIKIDIVKWINLSIDDGYCAIISLCISLDVEVFFT